MTTLIDQQVRRQKALRAAQPIEPTQLGTSAATIYTARADSDFLISHLWVANVTGGAVTYTLYFVPSGGTAGTGNAAVFQGSLAANAREVVEVAVNHRIPSGATVQALCSSANAVNIGGWGFDIEADQ